MHSSAHSFLQGSRLVRLLSDLNVSDVEVSQSHFSERFGQLMDLSGSITLSAMLEELPSVLFEPDRVSTGAIKDEFLKEHTALVRFIARRFIPGAGPTGDKLPTPAEFHSLCKLTGIYAAMPSELPQKHAAVYEPYRKFYVTLQGDIAIKIQHLRSHFRDAISGLSPELAQLSSIDTGLGDILSARIRELFAVIPTLLGRRFGKLIDEHWHGLPDKPSASDLEPWLKPGGWISTFCGEMREVLLAEIEVRLQPVLGMIDSLPIIATVDRTVDEGKNRNYG